VHFKISLAARHHSRAPVSVSSEGGIADKYKSDVVETQEAKTRASAMSGLDAQELLHLGLHATQQDDPLQAIECLKRCVELDPVNSRATYLLGALYAQIGMYDRAKETLDSAVALDPTEHTAVFQLGLLHLTSGDVPKAQVTWLGLDSLPEDHFLNLFRHGLLALATDEFERSAALLGQGISANTTNEPLNNDMRNLRASAEAAAQRRGAIVPGATEPLPAGDAQHLLSAYRQQRRQ
jgi:tetratricopeptide (TPR) repeat protein